MEREEQRFTEGSYFRNVGSIQTIPTCTIMRGIEKILLLKRQTLGIFCCTSPSQQVMFSPIVNGFSALVMQGSCSVAHNSTR